MKLIIYALQRNGLVMELMIVLMDLMSMFLDMVVRLNV